MHDYPLSHSTILLPSTLQSPPVHHEPRSLRWRSQSEPPGIHDRFPWRKLARSWRFSHRPRVQGRSTRGWGVGTRYLPFSPHRHVLVVPESLVLMDCFCFRFYCEGEGEVRVCRWFVPSTWRFEPQTYSTYKLQTKMSNCNGDCFLQTFSLPSSLAWDL